MSKSELSQFLLTVLKKRLTQEQYLWLEAAESAAAHGAEDVVLPSYTAATRKLGKVALGLSDVERAKLAEFGADLRIDHWGADEAGRALILLASSGRSDFVEIARACYEQGDSREQQSWLRSLSLLPESARFLDTAIDSCRTNIIPVFEAIACENRYPSIYFPELNFNQMVLKCLFNGIALARIVGLKSRLNSELSRMADHYARERSAAGRPVPNDIGLAQGVSQ